MSLHPDSQVALEHIRGAVSPGTRIAFVSGNFNIVHPGHLRLLKYASEVSDYLVVGVYDHHSPGALLSEELRLESVLAIGIVNHAFLLHDPPANFIGALQPSVVVKGKEHESDSNPEQEVVASYGGHLVFTSGEITFSSLDLIRNEFRTLTPSSISMPRDYPERHGFNIKDLRKLLDQFAGLRVLVIGDVIVDEYIACDALGMSQEDPSIVVTPVLAEKFVGGASIVAGHAAALGAEVRLLSVTGCDALADFTAKKLTSYNVDATLFKDESRPTALKQRYRSLGKTLLRVSQLKQHAIDIMLQRRLFDEIESKIRRFDLVMFSDFNYGCLPQPLVDAINALCMQHGVPMVADSQSSSQVGDVSRFRNMLLLKPTEREARLALRDFASGLVVITEALYERAKARNVILTLGSEGLFIHKMGDSWHPPNSDRLPAFNVAPKDVAGAGDSLLTGASLALVAGADIWLSAYLGSLVAACQVGRAGNVPLTRLEIESEMDT
jgi:rfaE bifunctional protein kinase chain/domain